jgi:hypothetical protein
MVVMLAVPAISLLAVVKMLVKAHPFFGMTSMAHGCHVLPEGDVGHLQCGLCILGGGGVVWLLQLGASALVASVRASSSFSFSLFSCSLFKKAKKTELRRREVPVCGIGVCWLVSRSQFDRAELSGVVLSCLSGSH